MAKRYHLQLRTDFYNRQTLGSHKSTTASRFLYLKTVMESLYCKETFSTFKQFKYNQEQQEIFCKIRNVTGDDRFHFLSWPYCRFADCMWTIIIRASLLYIWKFTRFSLVRPTVSGNYSSVIQRNNFSFLKQNSFQVNYINKASLFFLLL